MNSERPQMKFSFTRKEKRKGILLRKQCGLKKKGKI